MCHEHTESILANVVYVSFNEGRSSAVRGDIQSVYKVRCARIVTLPAQSPNKAKNH